MKTCSQHRQAFGLTLLELTVVILIVLSVTAILFITSTDKWEKTPEEREAIHQDVEWLNSQQMPVDLHE